MSKNNCEPIVTLLEQLKIVICLVIREMGIENTELKDCHERDTELCTKKSDLICLTAKMKTNSESSPSYEL